MIKKKGMTLVEVLISVVVLGFMSAIIITGLFSYRKHQAVDQTAHTVASYLEEARRKTLASENSARYGVHFDTYQVVLYKNTYSSTEPSNRIYTLHSYSQINSISLLGGGSEVLFERLTGETQATGTITVSLRSDTSKTKKITISQTGVIEKN